MTRKKKCLSPYENLKNNLSYLLVKSGLDIIVDDIPSKWENMGISFFCRHPVFKMKCGEELWNAVAMTLKCNRIARKFPINNDDFRSPRVEMLKGSDSWVLHIDNKIKYTYDITKCMFSAGNISEKLRIAQLSCKGETIVDLYAGIGYFTIPYLVHAKASLVHACEWNPHAVEALARNLRLNNVKDRCIIHYGDNREACPKGVADRVNLGLIPSSEKGWETACKALKSTGGILHIHGNVTSKLHSVPNAKDINVEQKNVHSHRNPEWSLWAGDVCIRISDTLTQLYSTKWTANAASIIRIKSYAPHIDHLVADICCKPSED